MAIENAANMAAAAPSIGQPASPAQPMPQESIEGAEKSDEPATSHENLGDQAMALSESQEEANPVDDKNNFEKLEIRIQKLRGAPAWSSAPGRRYNTDKCAAYLRSSLRHSAPAADYLETFSSREPGIWQVKYVN